MDSKQLTQLKVDALGEHIIPEEARQFFSVLLEQLYENEMASGDGIYRNEAWMRIRQNLIEGKVGTVEDLANDMFDVIFDSESKTWNRAVVETRGE